MIHSRTLLALACLPILGASEPATAAPPQVVEVTAPRDALAPPAEATGATRTATPLRWTPQSIQVVDRGLIEAAQDRSVRDALSHVSAVRSSMVEGFDGLNARTVRGLPAEQTLDGMPLYYNAGDREGLANVERIEVIKGPTAAVYGGGVGSPAGGLVNLVSKLPSARASYAASAGIGSFDSRTVVADVNQPIMDGVGSRVVAAYATSDSHLAWIQSERWSVDPSLTIGLGGRTSLTLQGHWSSRRQQDYAGVPLAGTVLPGAVSFDRTYVAGNPDVPDTTSTVGSLTATLTHRFSDDVVLAVPVRHARSTLHEPVQYISTAFDPATIAFFYGLPAPGPNDQVFFNALLHQDVTATTIAPTLTARFAAESVTGTILAGLDWDRVTDRGYLDAGLAGIASISGPTPLPWTQPPATDPVFLSSNRYIDANNTYRTQGAFAQVQATVWQRLHVLGGLRAARVELRNRDEAGTTGDNRVAKNRLLPRAGAVVDVAESVSLFAGYGSGMRGVPYSQAVRDAKPEYSQQFEGGVKVGADGVVNGSLAFYQLTRTNVPTTDPANPAFQVQSGKQRARGVDADLMARPFAGVTVLFSYALTNTELVDDTNYNGRKRIGVPLHSGRGWLSYRFEGGMLDGLALAAGFIARSEVPLNSDNTAKQRGVVTWDAGASYAWREFTVSVSGRNLTDRKYYEPYAFLGEQVAAAEPATVQATLDARF